LAGLEPACMPLRLPCLFVAVQSTQALSHFLFGFASTFLTYGLQLTTISCSVLGSATSTRVVLSVTAMISQKLSARNQCHNEPSKKHHSRNEQRRESNTQCNTIAHCRNKGPPGMKIAYNKHGRPSTSKPRDEKQYQTTENQFSHYKPFIKDCLARDLNPAFPLVSSQLPSLTSSSRLSIAYQAQAWCATSASLSRVTSPFSLLAFSIRARKSASLMASPVRLLT
jgi:hypothetical protein